MSLICTVIDSPVGPLGLAVDDLGLVRVRFHAGAGLDWAGPDARAGRHALLERSACQLGEYFAGQRRDFELPLSPRGTPFQRVVWAELGRIPYGQTISYAQRRGGSASRRRCVRSAPPMAAIRCRSSSPATGSSAPMAA